MVSTEFILFGILLPATLVGAALAFGWWRSGERSGPAWVGPLALIPAWVVGFRATSGSWPAFPPVQSTDMLLYVGVALGAIGCFEGIRPGTRSRRLEWAVVSLAIPWLFLRNLVRQWETLEAVAHLAALGAFVFATRGAFEALARRSPGLTTPVLLWIVVSSGSTALVMTGSALYAQLGGTLAAVLGAATVVALRRRDLSLANGLIGALAVLFACLCIGGAYLSELPRTSAVLLGLAPLACLLTRPRESRGIKSIVQQFLLIAIPVAVALFLAWRARPSDPYSDYY